MRYCIRYCAALVVLALWLPALAASQEELQAEEFRRFLAKFSEDRNFNC